MIFLSAQPDEFYFSWQLEIQILNFVEKGILKTWKRNAYFNRFQSTIWP